MSNPPSSNHSSSNQHPSAVSVSDKMRMGMRRLASGVCVIAANIKGEGFAMTASSVTSVSDNPASLLVCINKLVSQQEYFSTQASRFSVNVLGVEHEAVSNLCAGRQPGVNRFSIGSWSKDDPVPHLQDAQTVFFCETDMTISYGTHQIVIAHIRDVYLGSGEVNPLIYADGSYGDFQRRMKS